MPCPLCDTLARIRAAAEPAHIADLAVSTLILSEDQGCPGWCVLVLSDHHEHLERLPPPSPCEAFPPPCGHVSWKTSPPRPAPSAPPSPMFSASTTRASGTSCPTC